MTDNNPIRIYSRAVGLLKVVKDNPEIWDLYVNRQAFEFAREVVRLHDALAAWGQMLEYQIKVDERDLDETWLDASETLKMLRGIIAGGPMGKQGL